MELTLFLVDVSFLLVTVASEIPFGTRLLSFGRIMCRSKSLIVGLRLRSHQDKYFENWIIEHHRLPSLARTIEKSHLEKRDFLCLKFGLKFGQRHY